MKELYIYRLSNFGNTAYQCKSGDMQFNSIPISLWKLWYDTEEISFQTLALNYISDINFMTYSQLIKRIQNEKYLITRLENIFSNLEKKKVDTANGKN
ncbi:hypothetical protein BOVMAS36_16370 [Streptococcus uberis]